MKSKGRKHSLLTAFLALLVFVSCSTSNQSGSADETTSKETVQEEKKAASIQKKEETAKIENAEDERIKQDTKDSSAAIQSETKEAKTQNENVVSESKELSDSDRSALAKSEIEDEFSYSEVAAYSNSAYTVVNNNIPYFDKDELTSISFETYDALDASGRCTFALASISTDLMPTQERESISEIKPAGWINHSYDFVDGGYVYNRCHLIGYQLTAENANERNLITGTRYMNVKGMLPFENMVADYIKETGNHVYYAVYPVYVGSELVARGVIMEAKSVEDDGDGILFNVFCYNIQPGVTIDYATGENESDGTLETKADSSSVQSSSSSSTQSYNTEETTTTYILNTNTKKFHKPGCRAIKQMSEKNKAEMNSTHDQMIASGYDPCKICNP